MNEDVGFAVTRTAEFTPPVPIVFHIHSNLQEVSLGPLVFSRYGRREVGGNGRIEGDLDAALLGAKTIVVVGISRAGAIHDH